MCSDILYVQLLESPEAFGCYETLRSIPNRDVDIVAEVIQDHARTLNFRGKRVRYCFSAIYL